MADTGVGAPPNLWNEPNPNVAIFLGVLKGWFTNLSDQMRKKRIGLLIEELAVNKSISQNKTGGKIKIGNLIFQEYKVNTKSNDPLRIFGFFWRDILHVAAISTGHKQGKYGGMTWDGKDEWAAAYQVSTSEVDAMCEAAFDDELLYRSASTDVKSHWPSSTSI
jgi:hypothetical protein